MADKKKEVAKVYVKLRDGSGSWTSGAYKFGGAENVPQLVEKTPQIVRAIQTKLLVTVPEKDAKKAIEASKKLREKISAEKVEEGKSEETEEVTTEEDNEPKEYTKEQIQEVIEVGEYPALAAIVKDLNLYKGKGNISKADAIQLLEVHLSDGEEE